MLPSTRWRISFLHRLPAALPCFVLCCSLNMLPNITDYSLVSRIDFVDRSRLCFAVVCFALHCFASPVYFTSILASASGYGPFVAGPPRLQILAAGVRKSWVFYQLLFPLWNKFWDSCVPETRCFTNVWRHQLQSISFYKRYLFREIGQFCFNFAKQCFC